jgi:hypothetical protein
VGPDYELCWAHAPDTDPLSADAETITVLLDSRKGKALIFAYLDVDTVR